MNSKDKVIELRDKKELLKNLEKRDGRKNENQTREYIIFKV